MPERKHGKRFTETYLKSLRPRADGKPHVEFDTGEPALGVRITKSGAKLIAVYRIAGAAEGGKALQKKITLGPVSDLITCGADVQKWRDKVAEMRAEARMGKAPGSGAKEEGPITFAAFADEWYPKVKQGYSPGHRKQVERNMERAKKAFGSKPLADVTPGDIEDLRDKVKRELGPNAANKLLTALSPLFGNAVMHRLIQSRPTSEVKRVKIAEREEVLGEEEYVRFLEACGKFAEESRPWNGVDPRDIASILKLLATTGARRGEMFAADWADFDLGAGVWHRMQSKTGKTVDAHLMPGAVDELRAVRQRRDAGPIWMRNHRAVFPSARSKTGRIMSVQNAYKDVLKRAQLPLELHVHDLRASYASYLIYVLGLPPEIVALQTGHRPGSKALTRHYVRRTRDADDTLKHALAKMSAALGGAAPIEVEPE